MCFFQQTHIQYSSSVIQTTSPSGPPVQFHLPASGDHETADSSVAGVRVVPNEKVEAALLDWIPVDSRLCVVRHRFMQSKQSSL